MVWAGYNGSKTDSNNVVVEVYEGMFIGTEEELNKYGPEKDEDYQPILGPKDKTKLTCRAGN